MSRTRGGELTNATTAMTRNEATHIRDEECVKTKTPVCHTSRQHGRELNDYKICPEVDYLTSLTSQSLIIAGNDLLKWEKIVQALPRTCLNRSYFISLPFPAASSITLDTLIRLLAKVY